MSPCVIGAYSYERVIRKNDREAWTVFNRIVDYYEIACVGFEINHLVTQSVYYVAAFWIGIHIRDKSE